MKRILIALALFAATNVFAADKLKVVTTLSDLASLTKEVGGDRVDVTAIARGYQNPHFVEPKPSFLLLLRNADLLEVVGVELEIGWLPPLLDQSRNNDIRPGSKGYLDLSRGAGSPARASTRSTAAASPTAAPPSSSPSGPRSSASSAASSAACATPGSATSTSSSSACSSRSARTARIRSRRPSR